ncbi:MAG TPA: hypothetical protein VNF99_19640 [Stellaceae bacterium]|nr:hypothetical protein [Stellaceae bacterium]
MQPAYTEFERRIARSCRDRLSVWEKRLDLPGHADSKMTTVFMLVERQFVTYSIGDVNQMQIVAVLERIDHPHHD